MLNLHVSLRIPASCRRVFFQFENVVSDVSVADFKREILNRAGLDSRTQLELIYSCRSLSDESTLKVIQESQQQQSNNVVKIVYANIVKPVAKQDVKKLDGADQHQLFLAFRSAMTNPGSFRQTLQNACTSENLKLLIEKVPGLAEDHVALSMLQDWELMLHLADPKIVQALVEKHPAVVLAAKEIMSTVAVPGLLQQLGGSSGSSRRSHGFLARSLGADDDESMDQGPPQQQQQQQASITPAQLAAALNFVQNNLRLPPQQQQQQQQPSSSSVPPISSSSSNSQQRQSPRPTTTTTTSSSAPAAPSSSGGLTPQLFTQALLSAMASSRMGPAAAAATTPSASSGVRGNSGNNDPSNEDEQLRQQFDRFLPQMRELGIADDSLSLRALQATNGDVQAAINLIFAGLVDD